MAITTINGTINHTNEDAEARVAELGFPMSVLRPTIETWIAGMRSGTPFHAANYAGTEAYHQSLAELRIQGHVLGLEPLSRDGVELCFCLETRVAVVVAQGNARTGDTENLQLKPTTKYKRGPRSCEVLSAQLDMFQGEAKTEASDHEVWILLFHMAHDGETRVELSRPSVIDEESGTILNWHERIFLGAFPSGAGMLQPIPTDLAPNADVVVPIRKRG